MTVKLQAFIVPAQAIPLFQTFNYRARTITHDPVATMQEMIEGVTELIQLEKEGLAISLWPRAGAKEKPFPQMSSFLQKALNEHAQIDGDRVLEMRKSSTVANKFTKAVAKLARALDDLGEDRFDRRNDMQALLLGLNMAEQVQKEVARVNGVLGVKITPGTAMGLAFPRHVK